MEIAPAHYVIDPRTKPPRAWVAALLTPLVPGLGHVYAGAFRRGLVVWLGSVAMAVLLIREAFDADVDQRLFAGICAFFYLAWAMLDAARLAGQRPRTLLRRFNHWFVYLALGLAGSSITLALVLELPR